MTVRTRVFDDTSETKQYQYLWVPTNGAPGYTNEFWSHDANVRSRVMVDVVTPKFRELQNQGVIINNPLWLEDIHSTFDPMIVSVNWTLNNQWRGYMVWPYFPAMEIPLAGKTLPDTVAFERLFDGYTNISDLAANRAWANVQLSEAMLLASLGELPETLHWVRSVYERAVNLTKLMRSKSRLLREVPSLARSVMVSTPEQLKKLAKGTSKTAKFDLVSKFAESWLEYRYAIRPLIFEIKQCLEALKKTIEKGSRQTARGKEIVLSENSSIVTHTKSTYSSTTVTVQMRQTEKTTIICRAGVLFKIEEDLDALLSVWGIDQPLESVWELVPFSFIIDWFFSVGDTISAWSVNPSLTPLASWNTFILASQESRRSLSLEMSNKGGYVWSEPSTIHGKAGLLYMRKWRKPAAVRSIIPRFDLKLDLAKIIDLGMIGRQLLSGRRPYQKGA